MSISKIEYIWILIMLISIGFARGPIDGLNSRRSWSKMYQNDRTICLSGIRNQILTDDICLSGLLSVPNSIVLTHNLLRQIYSRERKGAIVMGPRICLLPSLKMIRLWTDWFASSRHGATSCRHQNQVSVCFRRMTANHTYTRAGFERNHHRNQPRHCEHPPTLMFS